MGGGDVNDIISGFCSVELVADTTERNLIATACNELPREPGSELR